MQVFSNIMSVILLFYALITVWSFIVQAARWSHQKERPVRGKGMQFGLVLFGVGCAISAIWSMIGQYESYSSSIVMCGFLWFLRKKYIFEIQRHNVEK